MQYQGCTIVKSWVSRQLAQVRTTMTAEKPLQSFLVILHFRKKFNDNRLFQLYKDNLSPKKCIILATCILFKDAIGKL